MKRPRLFDAMQPTVFFGSAFVVVTFVLFGAIAPELAHDLFGALQNFILEYFGWFYVSTTTLLLAAVVYLLFGRFGHIRLGGEDARPEFSYFAWFTMLFSAGMGTGLVFWAVAEPMSHYLSPPVGPGGSEEALQVAMRTTFFHWGLHPWAIYIVFGLSLAYFHFRHGLPLAPRSLLYPIIGKRIHGPIGHVTDIVATVGTLFGVATSLGLGAMQVNRGLAELLDVEFTSTVQVVIIACITTAATISVVTGIKHGIRRLSQLNMILAGLLFLFVAIAGPTLYLAETFLTSLGDYLQNLIGDSLWIDPDPDASWQSDWTLFYWSWWISWSPFVGVFVARISKGRTIREFIVSVAAVPTLITFLWLTVFGGTGLHLELYGPGGIAAEVEQTPSLSLYAMLGELPWGTITSVFATLLVIIFFITSSDSGSLVDDMVTSGGHPDPPRAQRVFWALSEGAVAAVLLLSGGLQALRTASLTSGLPMAAFLLVASWGLIRALRVDQAIEGVPERQALQEEPPER